MRGWSGDMDEMDETDETDEAVSYGRQVTLLAERHPEDTAIVHVAPGGSERRVPWGELERRANQVARLLEERGVAQGDTVAVALVNSAEHFFCTLAAWKLGATVLPLRWDLPPWERDRLLDLARPAAVVGAWEDAAPGTLGLDDVASSASRDHDPLPERVPDPARSIATSGSTGRPKLIVTPGPERWRSTPRRVPRTPWACATAPPSS